MISTMQDAASLGSNSYGQGAQTDNWLANMSVSSRSSPPADTIATNQPFPTSQRTCACLATLYLILDEIQGLNEVRFPASLALLRRCGGNVIHALNCDICPVRYITSVQNTQLLCTVLVSMAQSYRSIVDAIDAEAQEAQIRGETKSWTLSQLGSGNIRPAQHASSSLFPLDVTPAEWKSLARKIVKAEIVGTADGLRNPFLRIVDALEMRQVRWHASPPSPDFPKSFIHGPEKTPFCVLHCRQARRHVQMLQL